MDAILRNINDPSWWFTGLFFVAAAYILPAAIKLVSSVPFHAKGFVRKIKLKILRKIKNTRFDDTKVIFEANKVSAWFIVFVLSMFVFFYNYLTEPSIISRYSNETGGLISKAIVMLVLSIPVYIVEIIYLFKRGSFRLLMRSREKIRITKPYNGHSR